MIRSALPGFLLLAMLPAQKPADHQQGSRLSLPDELVAELEKMVEATREAKGIPGVSVAVGLNGRVVWTRGFGYSDLENKVKAKAETSYRLASISKSMTAVAAMQLVAQKKFDLDAPVQEYLPKFPKKRWPLTPRHLLSHLGGVRHYASREEVGSTKHYTTVRAGLVIFAKDPLLHEPGTKFRYTTYGYNLLGACVASAAGQGFGFLLKKAVFAPSGMAHTRVDSVSAIIPHRAQGYRKGAFGNVYNSSIVDTSNKIPGGGLCGTAADLVSFGIALTQGRLLDKKVLDAMWTPAKTRDGKAVGYGMGFSILKADKPRIVGHSGGQPRVNTMLIIRPDEDVVVAAMCNLERAGIGGLARKISDRVAANR